jgi:hypothetical protein
MSQSDIFNTPNPFSRNMTLGSAHPLTEMSTTSLPVFGWRPTQKAENFTIIRELTL